jgi:hypothetical protein
VPDTTEPTVAVTPALTPEVNVIEPWTKFALAPDQLMTEAVDPDPTVPLVPKAFLTSVQPESLLFGVQF